MNDFALLLERNALHADAAHVAGLVLEGRSADADAYALERGVAARLAAFRAAGGVL